MFQFATKDIKESLDKVVYEAGNLGGVLSGLFVGCCFFWCHFGSSLFVWSALHDRVEYKPPFTIRSKTLLHILPENSEA